MRKGKKWWQAVGIAVAKIIVLTAAKFCGLQDSNNSFLFIFKHVHHMIAQSLRALMPILLKDSDLQVKSCNKSKLLCSSFSLYYGKHVSIKKHSL